MIAIARAVDVDAKILILDEPTSSLDEQETAHLFQIIRQLQKQGLGIIFISHFLEQIYEICDHVTVLRNGELVGAYDLKELPRLELIAKMVGKSVGAVQEMDKSAEKSVPSDEVFLDGKDLGAVGFLDSVDVTIHKGEVIGLAGLLGSGRTETAELLFGLHQIDKGSLSVHGKPIHFPAPMAAMREKIAFCPEDRKVAGIIGDLTVRENIILAMQAKQGILRHIPYAEQVKVADDCIKLLNIKVSSRDQLVKNLSGGNQQKVVISKWLFKNCDILIFDEPTRGIDVGAKSEIYHLMTELAKEGKSIIMISSELPELLRLSDRIMVMCEGRVTGELDISEASQEDIMRFATDRNVGVKENVG